MATALTDTATIRCPSQTAPAGSLELYEAAGTRRDDVRAFAALTTIVRVLDGVIYVGSDDDEWILTPGDTATIPAGTTYRRWNAGDSDARWAEAFCGS